MERVYEPEVVGDYREIVEIVLSRHSRTATHMKSQWL